MGAMQPTWNEAAASNRPDKTNLRIAILRDHVVRARAPDIGTGECARGPYGRYERPNSSMQSVSRRLES
jgi:hypothetical protein